MDEEKKNESENKTLRELSPDDDVDTAKNDSEQKNLTLEDVTSEPESIDSETTAEIEAESEIDDNARQVDEAALNKGIDDPESVGQPDEKPEETESESAQPDTDGEADTEKDEQSDSEDKDDNEERTDIEEKEIEKAAKSHSADTDEAEEAKGSSEEQHALEEIDETVEIHNDVEGGDPPAQTQIESETAETNEGTDDLAEETAIETPVKKKPALKVAVSAIIIAAAFSGFFFFDDKSKIKAIPEKASKTSAKREIGKSGILKKKTINPLIPRINSVYNAKIEEITALRDRLLLKQKEVMRLKEHYRNGIEELEKEISDELQKGQCKTFFQAMENSSIAFTLRTIQRRQAYIQHLERPAKWIEQACEELLYIKRRTLMDLQVVEIVAGIDMNKHVRRINDAVRKYQPDADKLALETTNAQLEPLEAIWERIQEKTQQYATVRAHSKNQIISEQICTGNFNRLTELSEISGETAGCITEMQGSDLFLNSVSEISPNAAKQLINWKGGWICLNGVRALSPRAAHYLFQWEGNWISLNGLTEFPAEIGETLLQWEGRQLELMGLQHLEDFPTKIAFEYLARWERAGGKLFVTKSVRKKIDEIHRKSI